MNRRLMIAIDGYPDEEDYDWINEGEGSVNITISRNHPKYCEKCIHFFKFILRCLLFTSSFYIITTHWRPFSYISVYLSHEYMF